LKPHEGRPTPSRQSRGSEIRRSRAHRRRHGTLTKKKQKMDVATCKAGDRSRRELVAPDLPDELGPVAHPAGKQSARFLHTHRGQSAGSGFGLHQNFPGGGLGAGYITMLRAPLPHLTKRPDRRCGIEHHGEFIKRGCARLVRDQRLPSPHKFGKTAGG